MVKGKPSAGDLVNAVEAARLAGMTLEEMKHSLNVGEFPKPDVRVFGEYGKWRSRTIHQFNYERRLAARKEEEHRERERARAEAADLADV